MTHANVRRAALLEAIAWLEYRAEVCRQEEDDWAKRYGADSRGCATERAARHELELAIKTIASIANKRRNDKALRQGAAEREAFVRAGQEARRERSDQPSETSHAR